MSDGGWTREFWNDYMEVNMEGVESLDEEAELEISILDWKYRSPARKDNERNAKG